METIQYIGERLLPGQIGNSFIILAFISALVSCIFYFVASKENQLDESWRKIARSAFRIHSLAVIGIIATLFYMLLNHLFEYEYVWHHSNTAMPKRYILSCFWEGQEGSFLLWSFWHLVLGNILIKTSKNWEAPVMMVVASVQVFLSSMILGVYVFDYKFGSNPFTVLLREHPEYGNIPLFQNPNYLEKLDGRGLNPLLQNYWMTIHPPTLFLGFALTLVPFAYAIAGLWKKQYNEWQKFALPWAYIGIMILGLGILMGGAWAYEALSFGGFWAWDPVENASLVPWLTLVGAAHVMLINKNKGHSLFTTFFLTIISFILILYSTFLTRSGILGETSVHAFTDLGMSGQLLIYLLFYVVIAVVLLVINNSSFPKSKEEDALWSREFWMFVGALILLVSSFHILFNTSLPVWNKLFGLKLAPPTNAIGFYNSWQIPFAIAITVLIGFTQFLKYKNSDIKTVVKAILMPFIGSLAFSISLIVVLKLNVFSYALLLFTSIFAVWANINYFGTILKGKVKAAGASIAHIGFGLILLGALLSTAKKEFISVNSSGKNIESLDKQLSNSKNILLSVGDTLKMGDYFVTYKGKQKKGVNIYFEIEYYKKNNSGYEYQFTLKPLVQTNPRMGNVAEPDTRHFIHKDIYTHVTYASLEDLEGTPANANEYGESKSYTIGIGDTLTTTNSLIILKAFNAAVDKKKNNLPDSALAVEAIFKVMDINSKVFEAKPIFVIQDNKATSIEAEVKEQGVKINFWKIIPETGKIEITLAEKRGVKPDFIVMEAIIFPAINVLWSGCIIMVLGTALAVWQRIKRTNA